MQLGHDNNASRARARHLVLLFFFIFLAGSMMQMKQLTSFFMMQMKQQTSFLVGSQVESENELDRDMDVKLPSRFDVMHKQLHESAAAAPDYNITKKKYEVGVSVERRMGGLHDDDRILIAEIYSSVESVFEFGLGESTQIAAWVGVPRYVGVDSDEKWVSETRQLVNMDHFRFIFADVGQTQAWGYPKDPELKKIPFSYQSAPLNDEMEAFDFYLIDGRYRVACACASMLHAMGRGGDMKKVMFGVHDYPGRPEYHQLESLADIVRSSDRLRVFQVKSNTTEDDVYQMWKKNEFNAKR